MGRRRAVALVLVHVVVAVHILHSVFGGATLSPLEPSEAGYSIRSGAINAGAIFLVVLVLSTLVLGRFFCGWACHLVAYQDAARWVLVKIGLRPRPVRLRLLMLVPLFAAYWLYGRPLVERWTDGPTRAGLSLHLTTDEFWATFPGPALTVATFLVCGLLIVYVLGAKGFCTYGCPYGALFGLADRAARGRIRVNEDCDHTGSCTRTCSSNVDVAAEVARFGMVVDPGCMKCMDCVAGCPNGALSFAFTPRRAAQAPRRARRAVRTWDLSWPGELVVMAVFAGLFWVLYDLYRVIPFLLAVGLCAILAYLLTVAGRLLGSPRVELQTLVLKEGGRLTRAGRGFALLSVLVVGVIAHGALLQWHTKAAVARFGEAQRAWYEGDEAGRRRAGDATLAHLRTSTRWGLVPARGAGRMEGEVRRWRGEHERALACYERELAAGTRNKNVILYQGLALHALGRIEEARGAYERAFAARAPKRSRFVQLDWELTRMLRSGLPPDLARATHETRLDLLRLGLVKYPADAEIALEACKLLVRPPDPRLADPAEARRVAEAANAAGGRSDADLLAMLAFLHAGEGRFEEAALLAEESLQVAQEQGLAEIAADMAEAVRLYRRSAASGQR